MQVASCQLSTFDLCVCSLALALPQSGGRDYDLGQRQRWESISGTVTVHQCIISCINVCILHSTHCEMHGRRRASRQDTTLWMQGKGFRLTAGLTALDELLMLAPHRADEYDEAHPAVPSNRALHHLTKLTCLQLQVSSSLAKYHSRRCIGCVARALPPQRHLQLPSLNMLVQKHCRFECATGCRG
jgi:hypothetical protein